MTKTNEITARKITGVKTEAEKAKALKNAKGPKPGQARSNQTARYTDSDIIVEVKPVKSGGNYTAVSTGPAAQGGASAHVPNNHMIGNVAKLAVVGGSLKAFKAAYEAAKKTHEAVLAKGVDGRTAPHSSKAVGDKRAAAKATNKADAVTQKAPAPKVKAAKEPKASGGKYVGSYKWTGENKAREGTWRYAMLECAKKNATTDAGDACLKKDREFGGRKMDWRWMAGEGYIKFA